MYALIVHPSLEATVGTSHAFNLAIIRRLQRHSQSVARLCNVAGYISCVELDLSFVAHSYSLHERCRTRVYPHFKTTNIARQSDRG